jgi:hypothetical protein
MSRLTSEQQAPFSHRLSDPEPRDRPPAPPRNGGLFSNPGVVVGLAAIGLDLAWSYVEPDLRRYMKIRNM